MLDYQLNKLQSKAIQYEQKAVKVSLGIAPLLVGAGVAAGWAIFAVPVLNSFKEEFYKLNIKEKSKELIKNLNEYEAEYGFGNQKGSKDKMISILIDIVGNEELGKPGIIKEIDKVLTSKITKEALDIIDEFKTKITEFSVYSSNVNQYVNDNLNIGTRTLKALQSLTTPISFTVSQRIMELIEKINEDFRNLNSNIEAKELEKKEELLAQQKATTRSVAPITSQKPEQSEGVEVLDELSEPATAKPVSQNQELEEQLSRLAS